MQPPSPESGAPVLAYATGATLGPASRFGMASLAMAGVTVAWLLPPYLCWRGVLHWGPFADVRGGPLGPALSDTAWGPAGVTVVLAIVGVARPRRRFRWAGVAAVAIVSPAFMMLMPGVWK